MLTTRTAAARTIRPLKRPQPCSPTASDRRVRWMLLEISYAMHATRVVGYRGGIAPKKG